MDALILSCGTGGGHNAAGGALREELIRRGHRAVMMNPYTLRGQNLAGKIDHAYIATAQKAPRAFGAVYGAGELYRRLPFRSPVYYANQAMISRMEEYLEENHFDIVIMPHLFPAEIMTNMKRRGMDIPRTMFIATDYCCIPFTEETDCDAYVVPGEELTDEFAGRGIPREKIYPLGIPVGRSFRTGRRRSGAAAGSIPDRASDMVPDRASDMVPDKTPDSMPDEALCDTAASGGHSEVDSRGSIKEKEKADWEPGKRYLLIAGGSIGAGKIDKLIGLLLEQAERDAPRQETGIIVICGNNQELYWKLKRQYGTRVIVVGHTDYMADYLRISSLYITKPGGLSSTEAAVCGIPLLHMPAIPGCETHNVRYFREHGMSVCCDVSQEGAESVFRMLNDERACAEMVECQRRYIRRDAASDICRLAEEMVSGWEERRTAALCLSCQ